MRINKKGDVPTPYIVALVLGVIVIALVAYWLFFSGGSFGNMIQENACKAKKMLYCNDWKAKFPAMPDGHEFSASCDTVNTNGKENYYAPDCCSFDWAGKVNGAECGITKSEAS